MAVNDIFQKIEFIEKSVRRCKKPTGVFTCRFFLQNVGWILTIHSGRSPPANLDFYQKFRLEEKMKGKHPKRRRDKYNPYTIYELKGHYFISFKDGQGRRHEFEISKSIYQAFNAFELEDLKYLNAWDRHIEQSEVLEATLDKRALVKSRDFEESVIRNFQVEQLHKEIDRLPEKQKKRLILHYFYAMTYEEIARKENCSIRAVEYSVHDAIQKLKNIKNF